VDKNIHKCLKALNHISYLSLNGAQGRNRTTDTRIFNGGGVNFIFKINKLRGETFGVCASVFLVSF
jgi:hypothetical protein